MRFVSIRFRLILATVAWPFLVVLCSLVGGSNAHAESSPGATCPPGFSCFPFPPRDGACKHPAIILDEQAKATRYEDNPFSREYETACIAQANSSAVRQGLELRLKFGDGASKVYEDNYDEASCEQHQEDCKQYVLYDYFPEHGLFLVNVGSNENQQWLLVRQSDGKEQQINAPPGYSPNKKWLASVYWTDGGDDGNNGIDIFPADLNTTDPAFHYRPTEYECWEFAGWDGDDRLLLRVIWRVGDDPELVTWPAEAVLLNGEWQLTRQPPTSSRP
jgi:hypothetical protein